MFVDIYLMECLLCSRRERFLQVPKLHKGPMSNLED